MKIYRRIFLERKDFLFSLLFQIDLKFRPWCLVYKGRPLSIIFLGFQFNTTTSMGRLTLNVLLSFAQFEREVIGECAGRSRPLRSSSQ